MNRNADATGSALAVVPNVRFALFATKGTEMNLYIESLATCDDCGLDESGEYGARVVVVSTADGSDLCMGCADVAGLAHCTNCGEWDTADAGDTISGSWACNYCLIHRSHELGLPRDYYWHGYKG
jgi:hypothetical protein